MLKNPEILSYAQPIKVGGVSKLKFSFGRRGTKVTTQKHNDFVFLLGDSRTGTTSIHRLFCDLGYKSVHFYLKESGQIENSIENHASNWQRLKSFISESGFNAFADYPTRSFYRELLEWRPKARFILSTRRSTCLWADSMNRAFGLTGRPLRARMDLHERQNQGIRDFAKFRGAHFLEVCVDDDPAMTGSAISRFLGCGDNRILPHLNAGTAYYPMAAGPVLGQAAPYYTARPAPADLAINLPA